MSFFIYHTITMFPHHALPGHNLLWTCLRLPGGTGAYNIYVHGYALAHTLGWAFLLVSMNILTSLNTNNAIDYWSCIRECYIDQLDCVPT